jgi:hypothetical protein
MRSLLLLLALIGIVTAARAQNYIVSVDAFELGYTGGLLLKSDDGAGSTKDKDETDFRLRLNMAGKLTGYENLMWRASARILRNTLDQGTTDTKNSVWGAYGGILYNHEPSNLRNSIFASAGIGLEMQSLDDGSRDETGINIVLPFEAGKRWDMAEYAASTLAYAPSVEFLYRRYGGDLRDEFYKSGTELKFNFLKFDFLF